MERDWSTSNENTPERVEFIDVTEHLNDIKTQTLICDYEEHILRDHADDTERAECELAIQDEIFGWYKLPRQAEVKGSGLRFSAINPDSSAIEVVHDVTVRDGRITALDLKQFSGSKYYRATLEVWSNAHQAYYYFFLDRIDSLVIKVDSLTGEEILDSLNVLYESIRERVTTVDFLSKSSERQHQLLGSMVQARNRALNHLISKEIELHAQADKFYTIYDDMPLIDLTLQNNYAGSGPGQQQQTLASGIFVGCELADRLQWSGRMETGLSNGRAFQFDAGAPCVILKDLKQKCTHYIPINQILSLD